MSWRSVEDQLQAQPMPAARAAVHAAKAAFRIPGKICRRLNSASGKLPDSVGRGHITGTPHSLVVREER